MPYLKKACLFIALIAFLSKESFCQSLKKNIFSIYYTEAFTKTNLRYDRFANSYFEDLYSIKKPTKGIRGYSIGITYGRIFKDRYHLTIGGFYSVKGQKSPFFKISSGSKNMTSYRLKLESLEIPITLYYRLTNNNKLSIYVKGGIGADIYLLFTAQSYLKLSDTNEVTQGCCSQRLYHIEGNTLKKFSNHASDGLIRISSNIGINLEYQVFDFMSLFVQPEIKYFSNILNQFSTVVPGTAVSLGMGVGVNFHF